MFAAGLPLMRNRPEKRGGGKHACKKITAFFDVIFWISGFLDFWDAATRFFIVAQVKIRFPVRTCPRNFHIESFRDFPLGITRNCLENPGFGAFFGVFLGFGGGFFPQGFFLNLEKEKRFFPHPWASGAI